MPDHEGATMGHLLTQLLVSGGAFVAGVISTFAYAWATGQAIRSPWSH